jgi:Molecular chaperone GrpE (heat shock protein)
VVKSKSKAETVKSKSRSKTVSTKKKQVDKKISKEKQKIAKLENELQRLKDNHIRLKAEFDNFRKRKVNEISKLLQYEGESVLKEFIPIIDDLERMINFDNSSSEDIKDGILLVKTKIDKLLNNLEVKAFSKKG